MTKTNAKHLPEPCSICSNGYRSPVTWMPFSNAGAGLPNAVQAEQEAKSVSRSLPMPQVSPKPTQPRVGQRAPERDPVGETTAFPVRKAIGCSFTEVIVVTLAQMEESGVSRFECPTC